MNSSCLPNKPHSLLQHWGKPILRLGWPVLLMLAMCACGTTADAPPKAAGHSLAHDWQRISVAQFEESGTTIPFVVARQAEDRNVHIAYYFAETAPDDTSYQRLNYLVWNPDEGNIMSRAVDNRPAPTGVDGFDRCDQFDLALDQSTPVLIYPTYKVHPTLLQKEADIMVNLFQGGGWNEATGAIGFVERNPVFQDGHATENMSVAVDSLGNIHISYQFYTEGIDSANFRYPDLHYVYRDRASLFDPLGVDDFDAIEEQVDGNQFSTYGDHNSVGYFCKLILDPQELPVIIYGEHGEQFNGTFALKAAFRNASGQWSRETIDALPDGWTVGGISAAFYPPDPDDPEAERPLAVAYALRSPSPEPDDAHRLMFAVKRSGQWSIEIVDETNWCGTHCSLAFTPQGLPAIAYFDEQSHSGRTHQHLRYAQFNGLMWQTQTADEFGIVGQHNSLWFDANGTPNICTYSDEDNEILIVRRVN